MSIFTESCAPMTTDASRLGFWDRAATWKAVLLIVGYLVFYVAVSQLIGLVFGDEIADNLLSTATSIFLALVLPVGIGAVALLVFTARVGWLHAVFGPQPISGSRWMWIAPVLIVTAIVAHTASTDWSAWNIRQVAMIAVAGLCIGVAEELATRGLTVKILRDAGHRERFVMVVSSLLFALMHLTNLIAGMSLSTVLVTVIYTFSFGTCMYLSMRVTGTIWAAIALHAITDPTTFLATGGVDEAVTGQSGGWALLASWATVLMMVFAVVAIFLVRGKASEPVPAP